MSNYYQDSYFEQRTDRGYNNYKSQSIQKEVSRVFTMNLTDLKFFAVEPSLLASGGRSLDVGCAAGYFVEYLNKRGWQSEGIEISKPMAEFAQSRGLKVSHGDFLESTTGQNSDQYNLISLWASLEHFAEPARLIQRLSESLKPGGS
ncbi:MAG: class I SAM-dependent methyltransferase, partial [Leptonema sp. (in: Bacteria)]|nr:class I SAM-dependent methyltransferase [Leptonema sp. (in: bacteria)]